jgi:hypothetical protein
MILLPEIAVATFLIGFWLKGKFKTKNTIEINDGSFHYQNIWSWHCPKCGLNWNSSKSLSTTNKYCECFECAVGHYHRQCLGKIDGSDHSKGGCHFKFIMRAKS